MTLLTASTPRIDLRAHPHGISSLEPVWLNGTQQWVLIRSEDVTNPIALFVHGGPGTSQLTLMRRNTRPLERHFTVVNWDQRGACKSYAAGRDPTTMTVRQFVDDVLALSAMLAKRFRQERIVLVGHSWGSAIGLLAVAQRPDLFSAYVGIGQVSRMSESERLSWTWTLDRARNEGDLSAVKALTRLGPPPYRGHGARAKFMAQRQLLGKFGGEYFASRVGAFGVVLENLVFSREYTLGDRLNFFRGIFRSLDLLLPELYRIDLFEQVPEVKVPAYFCLGRHDHEVPSELSARYVEALRAPRKGIVWFERSAHLANTEEKEKFNRFMIDLAAALHDGRAPDVPAMRGDASGALKSLLDAARSPAC